MRVLTQQDRELCRMQGSLFEQSPALCECSSPVFVRRFMNSQLAKRFDAGSVLYESTTPQSLARELEEEYGPSAYGKVRYAREVLYWMGYLYRYWCCATGLPSKRVFKLVPARELSELYGPYHTLDPAQAIERICEAKGAPAPAATGDDDWHVAEGVELLRRMHQRSSYKYFAIKL